MPGMVCIPGIWWPAGFVGFVGFVDFVGFVGFAFFRAAEPPDRAAALPAAGAVRIPGMSRIAGDVLSPRVRGGIAWCIDESCAAAPALSCAMPGISCIA